MARRIILILIAILVSGGAIFLAQQWLRGPAPPATQRGGASGGAPPPPTQQVLVAKTDLYAGQFIRPEELAWQTWPGGPLPDSYLVQPKARAGDLVGSVVRSRIAQGQPLTLSQIVRPGDRGFLAAVLTPGQRAVTVNVTPSSGLAGFAFPGDRVDLILTMTLVPVGPNSNGQNRHVSETLLHDVRILGMDQSFTDGRKDEKADLSIPKTATLEVTPKQVEILAVAGELGSMSLSLRSLAVPGETGTVPRITKTWDTEATQISLVQGKTAAAQPPPVWTIDVVHGSADTQVALPKDGIAPRPAS